MANHIHEAAQWFIRSARTTLEANNQGDDGLDEALARLAEQDVSASAMTAPKPTRLPACRLLPDAVAASLLTVPDMAAAVAALEEDLNWRHNPNYSNEAMGQSNYMANYAYAEVIGPHGLYKGDDFILGMLLLGPGLYYPNHAHPASELYWILSGDSQWRIRDEEFMERDPGETIMHEPFVPHAMKTGHTPLLATYMWLNDVEHAAMLV